MYAIRSYYEDHPHLLAVEQFMQQYYRHTMGLHERCMRFIERCRRVPFWRRLVQFLPAARVDEYFVVQGSVLTVAEDQRAKVLESPALLLRLFDLAREKRLTIAPALLEDIHRHVGTVSEKAYRTPEVSRIFLTIMAGPGTTATRITSYNVCYTKLLRLRQYYLPGPERAPVFCLLHENTKARL